MLRRGRRFSQHFHQREFMSKDGAPMPRGKRDELQRLVTDYLEAGREEFGRCTVISGHRSARHNERVGGAPHSFHLHTPLRPGAAADVVFERGNPAEWAAFFVRLGAGGVGRYATFVHVDNRREKARW